MFNPDPWGIKPVRKKCTFLPLTLAATAVLTPTYCPVPTTPKALWHTLRVSLGALPLRGASACSGLLLPWWRREDGDSLRNLTGPGTIYWPELQHDLVALNFAPEGSVCDL